MLTRKPCIYAIARQPARPLENAKRNLDAEAKSDRTMSPPSLCRAHASVVRSFAPQRNRARKRCPAGS